MSGQHRDGHTVEVDRGESVNLGHQALRREVNDQIHRINRRLHAAELGTMDVMCECVHADCMGLVVIPVLEYEALRRMPNRFLVKAGHEIAGEQVVGQSDGRVVVERPDATRLHAVPAQHPTHGERS
jgi:hypothetical protein